jgi:MFS family permease
MSMDRFRGRFYYGWVIVAVMSVAGSTVMALGTVNFGLFITPMGQELGISRASFGWAQSLRQLAAAATSPFVGILLDRYGARWLLAGSVLVTGAALMGLSRVENSVEMMLLFVVIGLAGYAWPGTLMTSVPVMKWFVRDRGRAVALVAIGILPGGLIFLPLSEHWIATLGWRDAWQALGLLGIVIVVPLSVLFLRRQPEDLGLEVDGGPREVGGLSPPVERSWKLGEARRTRAFWTLTVVFSALALAVGTIGLHRIANFTDRGIAPSTVALGIAFDASLASLVTLAMGWMSGRVRSQVLGAIGFLSLAASCGLTIHADEPWEMFVAVGLFGSGIGAVMYLQNIIWAEFFGRVHIGAIRGFTMPISLFLGAAGAPAAGYVKDVTGSYDLVWWGSTVVMLLGGLTILFARPPIPPIESAQPELREPERSFG